VRRLPRASQDRIRSAFERRRLRDTYKRERSREEGEQNGAGFQVHCSEGWRCSFQDVSPGKILDLIRGICSRANANDRKQSLSWKGTTLEMD
jgi:DMSO/TMAO reductase YedYZ molybdopterin-dependent catalytic subunit